MAQSRGIVLTLEGRAFTRFRLTKEEDVDLCLGLFLFIALLANLVIYRVADLLCVDLCLEPDLAFDRGLICGWEECGSERI
jgi:hypothetical protein